MRETECLYLNRSTLQAQVESISGYFGGEDGNIRYFDFYKNSYNGTLSVKLPDDFKGTVSVFNSMGVLVLTSEDDMINQDLSTLNKKPLGIYRAVFTTQQNRFVKNFIN